MSSGREKDADEIFCASCGETIKKRAEICPHCGVRNKKNSPPPSQKTSQSVSSATHDPSRYETTVSDTWWYGVGAGVILWIIVFMFAAVAGGGSTIGGASEVLLGLLSLIAWVGLPVAAYFDMQYIRANAPWNPNTVLWVVLLAIWIVNIVAGVVYLYRRHEVLGRP